VTTLVPSRWAVLREEQNRRWGGDLRRHHIFARLGARTGARFVHGWTPRSVRQAVRPGRLDVLRRRALPPPRLAASEMMTENAVALARELADPCVVAIYDDGVAQSAALGIALPAERVEDLRRRRQANLEAFRRQVVPTRSFAELVGLDLDQIIVGGNGTDVRRIRPGPWPSLPAIGLVSGAAPGRGTETIIEAARALRGRVPDLRLLLWLAATGKESERYLDELRASAAGERWIEIATVEYGQLTGALRRASILVIPHPANDYMEVAMPVKLFDSMAAGRPIVVTPRREMAAIVREHGVGVVAAGDAPDDLAEAMAELLGDEARARAIGAAARAAAEHHFDWQVVGERLASAVLEREG